MILPMITNDEKVILKEILRGDYVTGVVQILNENNIISNRGKAYSRSMIRRVFNGFASNIKIEHAIFALYAMRKAELEKEKLNRMKILGILE